MKLSNKPSQKEIITLATAPRNTAEMTDIILLVYHKTECITRGLFSQLILAASKHINCVLISQQMSHRLQSGVKPDIYSSSLLHSYDTAKGVL